MSLHFFSLFLVSLFTCSCYLSPFSSSFSMHTYYFLFLLTSSFLLDTIFSFSPLPHLPISLSPPLSSSPLSPPFSSTPPPLPSLPLSPSSFPTILHSSHPLLSSPSPLPPSPHLPS
eukprot:Phypoly_transcript_08499.p3 GENE.Phypoly_transcript_08499~~Phypoly_transcript_08499.p3  ORF type:complete len:116 (-),score=50.33 Phypoly_transcript_08499:18-365(-)